MSATTLAVETPAGPAQVELTRPRHARALLVLGHGAGGGVTAPDLLAVHDAAVAADVAVARVVQPYRVAGRRTPPAPKVLDPAWQAAVAAVRAGRGLGSVPLFVGGRSSGARVACRTADVLAAAGVVALAFPLHPPGRPEVTRLDELIAPSVPTLVVQGDRDAFGMPPADAVTRLVVVPGADHALKRDPAAVATAVLDFVTGLIG
jgi:predicted alpha/beta-hydrolase family hydrolase